MQQGQSQTGTRDETYNVISTLYHALQGVENCQTYLQDASGDEALRTFFEDALEQQRQIAERGKQVLQQCLQRETGQGGASAFSFGQTTV